MSDIQLLSPLSPIECEDRLRAAIDGPGLWTAFGEHPVVGLVTNETVEIRKRIMFRHQYQTILCGTWERVEEGTLFHGTTRIEFGIWDHRRTWYWLFQSLIFFVIGWAILDQVMLAFAFAALSTLMFVGISWFGQELARNEEAFLVEFVSRIIQSKPTDH